jgi:hypothetical protein
MTSIELKKELDSLLRVEIKSNNYIKTGELYKSVNFVVNNRNIKLQCKEYIKYLDEGTFLTRFFNSPRFLSLIGDYMSSQVVDEVNKKI